jgi:hypothetical protein
VGRPRAHRGLALGHVIVEWPAFSALSPRAVSIRGAEYVIGSGAVQPSGLVGYLTPWIYCMGCCPNREHML